MTTPPLHTLHSRHYHENKYVYPVLSRRSKGISLGVNLNPDKVCNFDCIYCQVDRRSEAETDFVATEQLLGELDSLLDYVVSGKLYTEPPFDQVPEHLRRLNDIAFSGDGEPTTFRNFDEIIQAVADLKLRRGLHETKLVLITNASMFHRPAVQRGLEILDRNQGEIWAKLDAGTEEYYRTVERTKIPFSRILDNITAAARIRPLVIQSLFLKIDGVPVSSEEITAYADRLNEILQAGGQLKLVQVYTVARTPAESYVSSLSNEEVDQIATTIRQKTSLPTECYYA
ncbi:MAG: radical SAM protein [Planctomycetaceae bacterium]|nr:radical SAM protein [Planctomycetaceae bacterium]